MRPKELEAQLENLHTESFGWALHCCGRDETEAEDVLQTAYLKVVSGKAHFEGRSSFRTWFFGVVRRTAQEARRRVRTHDNRTLRIVPETIRDEKVGDPTGAMEREDSTRRLLQAMDGLSERQREVLHLVFYQDLTIAEAAGVMGVSLGSARTHYERGKDRLRTLLLQEHGNDETATGS